MKHNKTAVRGLLLFFLVLLGVLSLNRFLGREQASTPYLQLHGQTMGTTWSARVVTPPGGATITAGYAIQRAVNRVDSLMSTYKPNSELMRFNHSVGTEPVPVSADFAKVVATALEISTKSRGALDITVWPLVELWGFGAGGSSARVPSPDTLKAVASRIGYTMLTVDERAGTLQKARKDIFCDVSAVAKGYGVDLACEALVDAGYQAFLMEIGGELRSRGRHPEGRSWTIAVEKPDPERRQPTIRVPLEDMAAATSGSYRNFIEGGGKRRSHIIDPRTLAPVDHGLVSVTVLHPQAAVADAWATALMVLGPKEGYQTAQEEGLAAYFISQEADGSLTPKWTQAWPAFDSP